MSGTIIGAFDLDAPDQARDALALATWLSDATAGELVLASVVPSHGEALSPRLARRRQQVAALAGRPVQSLVLVGTSPARLLHQLADERQPYAVVIGSSRSGAD